MPTFGVNVAVLDAGRILLTQREDFEVWCLPGGHVDSGESAEAAALREVREETGLVVELTRHVGTYVRPRWRDGRYRIVVFAARPVAGALIAQPEEVRAVDYFPPDALPGPMLLGQPQRIRDVFEGRTAIARTSEVTWPFASFDEALRRRDESSLSRATFYERHVLAVNEGLPDALEASPGSTDGFA
jgi:8-oxo-dGTP diphosphatase